MNSVTTHTKYKKSYKGIMHIRICNTKGSHDHNFLFCVFPSVIILYFLIFQKRTLSKKKKKSKVSPFSFVRIVKHFNCKLQQFSKFFLYTEIDLRLKKKTSLRFRKNKLFLILFPNNKV